MVDTVSQKKRSEIMSKIRSRDTKPELSMRLLSKLGFEYQVELVTMEKFVKPDWCHRRKKIAVFIDGDFFHGCPLHYKEPKTNVKFWREKVRRNRERDALDNKLLTNGGWFVIRIWECSLRKKLFNATKIKVENLLATHAQHIGEVIVI